MSRPHVFIAETRLWHAAEGWRTFPVGETDPGGAWHDVEGGRPQSSGAETGLLADLEAAHAQIASLEAAHQRNAFDLAMMGKDRDEAAAKLEACEQRARDAERARDDAQAAAHEVTVERDRLAEHVRVLGAKLAGQPAPEPLDRPTPTAFPDDWETWPFLRLRALANKVSLTPVSTKPEVMAAIRAHLAAPQA